MAQIAGSYKLDKNENLAAYVTSLGLPDGIAKKAETAGLTMEVIVEGNNYSFNSSSGINLSFTLDQEFDEPLPIPGVTVKSIAKNDGDNKISISSTVDDGRTGTRTYEFSDSGIIMTLEFGGVTAKRFYSRL